MNENFNCIQQAAYDLIQSDARFIYTIVDIHQNAKNIDSNYILMSQPYIGIFTDGAEQWSKKVGLNFPQFSGDEKEYGDTSTYNVIVCHFPLQNLINKRIPLIVKSSA